MPTSIEVEFDNPTSVFFAGQIITGRILISSTKNRSCRAVTVDFRSFSKLEWIHHDHKYTNTEKYYHEEYYLWGDGKAARVIKPGKHCYSFSFTLPANVPTSFCSSYGEVRHECTGRMYLAWKKDKKIVKPFSVNTLYDLNTDSKAAVPAAVSNHMCLGWLCCKSGPVSLTLSVDHQGYVPGESIKINAECSNMSNRNIKDTWVMLTQRIEHIAKSGDIKVENLTISRLSHGEVYAGDSDSWTGDHILIPPLPPTNLNYCNMIDIKYELVYKVDGTSLGRELSVSVPIIIGSIPLQQNFLTLPSAQNFVGTTEENCNGPKFPGVEMYPNMPVPTLPSRAVTGDFKPTYVTYGIQKDAKFKGFGLGPYHLAGGAAVGAGMVATNYRRGSHASNGSSSSEEPNSISLTLLALGGIIVVTVVLQIHLILGKHLNLILIANIIVIQRILCLS